MSELNADVLSVVGAFTSELGGVEPSYRVKERPDGPFLLFEFANPPSRMYELLKRVTDRLPADHTFQGRTTIDRRSKKPPDILSMPETELLQREISSSLTVDRNTFGSDFLARYTPSVTGLEKSVVLNANYAIYGRRGSGKSSLLAYAMHHLRNQQFPYAWVAMQTYASRADKQSIAAVLSAVLLEAAQYAGMKDEFKSASRDLDVLAESEDEAVVAGRLTRLVPRLRRMLSEVATPDRPFTLFLDDLHVVNESLQPELLAFLYSVARGNNIYIKLSGIEQLTVLWDGGSKKGLESPHDIQILMLDHNLTNPDQSRDHITSILDRHAVYCGLPGIQFIASPEFLDRLVLSAAAVPRDALSLFSKSLARSAMKKQKTVSVTSLNAACSEAIEEKLKDVEKDVSTSEKSRISECLEKVKKFCLSEQKKNAFLVKIVNGNQKYRDVQRLTALRFVHILHEGITPHKAGERYVALMLDYGFYIGIRAAKSITLFPDRPRQLAAKELRTLPILVP